MKDEINFHGLLKIMRQFHKVTLKQVCSGLCSVSMMKRVESGERLPEKQVRDRMMARMGVSIERYEDYLSKEEYEQWHLRQQLFCAIEEKQTEEAERILAAYRVYENQNVVEAQYCTAMEFMILQLKNDSIQKQREVIERAVKFTIAAPDAGLSEEMLLAEQEINLLIEYIRLRERDSLEEAFIWRKKQYQMILNYIETSRLDSVCRAKVYPKAAYYLSCLILEHEATLEELALGMELCNQAVEILRESSRLYYFMELMEVSEKLADRLQKDRGEESIRQMEIAELYEAYGVNPYMENFCYLYRGGDSFCIEDVIRVRRKMFGMTKEKLCQGICSVKTLTRLERKKTKTQMKIVRQLFERLGLYADYVRTRVITNDAEILKLAEQHVWYENNHMIKEWMWSTCELEKKLNMEIPQNRQFMMHSRFLLELRSGKITQEEYVNRMIELLEKTIPLEKIMKAEKKFLSREEYTYIRGIGMRMEMPNPYIEIIREICAQSEEKEELTLCTRTYEFLMMGVISYLGNIGAYEESDRYGDAIVKQCLIHRRQMNLAEALYNNVWNYQQRVREGKPIRKVHEVEKELKRCLLLSEFNRMKKFVKFFEGKLLKRKS